jgi:16S rRNA (cytidine1402-2'-O)-methyltransferase
LTPAADASTRGIVATPLGNLEDVTLRAVRILKEVALIACEDTRRTSRLLQAHGITTPTTSYFEHNEKWKGEKILALVREGRSAALVSDAGTPGISDPGYRLVRDARDSGLTVVPVPGPSAVVAALSVSGLPSDRFLFVGFLPSRSGARARALQELSGRSETLVFYESPLRVVATLADMRDALGDREMFLCREATKVHEEYVRGTTSEVRALLAARPEVKGEVVLVVSGAGEPPPASAEDVTATYAALVAAGRTRREAVKETARRHSLPARDVYARVLKD